MFVKLSRHLRRIQRLLALLVVPIVGSLAYQAAALATCSGGNGCSAPSGCTYHNTPPVNTCNQDPANLTDCCPYVDTTGASR